jgi:hypothetical protein
MTEPRKPDLIEMMLEQGNKLKALQAVAGGIPFAGTLIASFQKGMLCARVLPLCRWLFICTSFAAPPPFV